MKDDLKKSRVEDSEEDGAQRHEGEASKSEEAKAEAEESAVKGFLIGESSESTSGLFPHWTK